MATPPITLYFIPGASSLFPHILLRYCDIPFTPHALSVAKLAALPSNEKGLVPVLELDGNRITENPAIAHAINQLAPEKHLFGSTSLEFVRVCEWLNFIAGPLHAQAWGPYIRPFRFTTDTSEQALAAVKQCARDKTLSRFATIESSLKQGGPWLLGKNFTAADAYLLPFYRLVKNQMEGLDLQSEFPHYTKHANAVMEIEAVKQALNCEQELAKTL